MTFETYAFWYFVFGLIYLFVNGAIRKLDTDDDWLLPFAWFLIWPIPVVTLIIKGLITLYKKYIRR